PKAAPRGDSAGPGLVARECGRRRGGRRRALDPRGVHDAPRELLAAERVLEAVAGHLARLVELERVEQPAVERHLATAVGPLDDRELTVEGLALCRCATDGQRLPEGEASAVTEHLSVPLLVAPIQRPPLRVDKDAGPADPLDGHGGAAARVGTAATTTRRKGDRDSDNESGNAGDAEDEQSFHRVPPV